jgi:hypothetical protein
MKSETSESIFVHNDARKVFRKKGTCSRTFFYLLNREFGNLNPDYEQAIDPLAGGIMQEGHQCGMLWGACLAVGTETFRKYPNNPKAIALAMRASQHIVESFSERTKTVNCKEITDCDFSSKWSMAKYFFSGKFLGCFTLAEEWAPEAVSAAEEGLSISARDLPPGAISCASEVASQLGASEKEKTMVAGFAGGLGLSGNGCGALAAAIWLKTLEWNKNLKGKPKFFNPMANKLLTAFKEETGGEMLCSKICGQWFSDVDEHTEYIRNGGCSNLMHSLTQK